MHNDICEKLGVFIWLHTVHTWDSIVYFSFSQIRFRQMFFHNINWLGKVTRLHSFQRIFTEQEPRATVDPCSQKVATGSLIILCFWRSSQWPLHPFLLSQRRASCLISSSTLQFVFWLNQFQGFSFYYSRKWFYNVSVISTN